ncbi:MAG: hypothetical protein ACJ8FT_08450, partial [Sphingomonas sp.]
MAALRHIIIAILAAIAMLSLFPTVEAAEACPMEVMTSQSMWMPHRAQPAAPISHDQQVCAACLAVMPPPPLIESHVLPPVALFTGKLQPLSGVGPALDPPPPR